MPSYLAKPIITDTGSDFAPDIREVYYSSAYPKKSQLKTIRQIWDFSPTLIDSITDPIVSSLKYRIIVINNDETIFDTKEQSISGIENIRNVVNEIPTNKLVSNNSNLADIKTGKAQIIYDINYRETITDSVVFWFTVTYNLLITENTEPLPKWNAYTVLERVLNVVEPLRQGETPRFKIDRTQKVWLESIETPEFQFTQSTLREVLQGIGSYIHAEPRLIKNEEEYIITFDKYGGNTYSEFATTYKTYASQQQSINIENFATNLDSSVDNFINSFENSVNGSISEPFYDGYKSVLAEGSYVRITDESMYIYTQYPIYSVKKLTCNIEGTSVDITPYVFESAEYKTLSSYDNNYPTSKSYALYYTIGQNGIYGLNFKREQLDLTAPWDKYSIVKILKSASNKSNITNDFTKFAFNVEYVPIYPARVQQNKSIISAGKKWTKPYNQSQNLIETQYYGQNLKGVIARLGNIDKTLTYVIMGYPTFEPKIGDLFNDDYYIADVSYEVQPYYTKMTLALSKDFNRYSEYVGVNSVKRMYEISERQAFESEISYREFVVFGEKIEPKYQTLLFNEYGDTIIDMFSQDRDAENIAGVVVQGLGYNNEPLREVVLPTITSTFGNALVVAFKYADNYSAGTYAENITDMGANINAIYTQTLPYADEYGRIKYLNLQYLCGVSISGDVSDEWLLPPNNKLGWVESKHLEAISTNETPVLVEKGNTETISFNYQLEFVSTDENIIIGDELPKLLYFIRSNKKTIRLLLCENRLSKFNTSTWGDTSLIIDNRYYDFKQLFDDEGFKTFKWDGEGKYKAWAFVYDDGNQLKESRHLILGKNMNITKETNLFEGLKISVINEKDLYK